MKYRINRSWVGSIVVIFLLALIMGMMTTGGGVAHAAMVPVQPPTYNPFTAYGNCRETCAYSYVDCSFNGLSDKDCTKQKRTCNWSCTGVLLLDIASKLLLSGFRYSGDITANGGISMSYDFSNICTGNIEIKDADVTSNPIIGINLIKNSNEVVAAAQKDNKDWSISFDEALLSEPLLVEIKFQYGDKKFIQANDESFIFLGGTVWNDLNGDGIRQSNEPPLQGVTLQNADSSDNVTTQTDQNGKYTFPGFATSGQHVITVTGLGEVTITKPQSLNYDVTPEEGQQITDLDFGITANKGVALDMDVSTGNYEVIYPSNNVESELSACQDDEIWIAVAATGVKDLDTYQVEVSFDTGKLQFLEGVEDNPISGIKNLLKKNGGITAGFLPMEKTPGTVNISNTLTGTDCNQAPEGSGVLAFLKFKVLNGNADAVLTLGNVFFLDCNRKNEEITALKNGKVTTLPCDFNSDGTVDFIDLGLLANHWLFECVGDGWDPKYDLNGDCIVNYLDLGIFGDSWLKESPCY